MLGTPDLEYTSCHAFQIALHDRDRRCSLPTGGTCQVTIASFAAGATVPAAPDWARWGGASGSFSCDRLQNPTTRRYVDVTNGSFSCDASDWSAF